MTKPRILCIEDHETYGATMRDELAEALGAEVELATDGEQAVKKLADAFQASHPYQLIVLDMIVPRWKHGELDHQFGLNMLVELRDRYHIIPEQTVIVVYTPYLDKKGVATTLQNCVKCIRAGAYDYITKTDPETEKDNLPELVTRCREFLQPAKASEDALMDWFEEYRDTLIKTYGGKVVALITEKAAREARLEGDDFGEYVLIVGDDYGDVRRQLLEYESLIWSMPEIVNIPTQEEVEW